MDLKEQIHDLHRHMGTVIEVTSRKRDNMSHDERQMIARLREWQVKLNAIEAHTSAQLREFAGFLTAELPELHAVEMGRMANAVEKFLEVQRV